MTNINDEKQIRFENGGKITIGGNAVINVAEGTLRFREPGREAIPTRDRARLKDMLEGDARPVELSFDVRYTGVTYSEIIAAVSGNGSNGLKKSVSIVVEVYRYAGSTVGDQWTFATCVLPEGYEYQAAGAGTETDRVALSFIDYEESPAHAALT